MRYLASPTADETLYSKECAGRPTWSSRPIGTLSGQALTTTKYEDFKKLTNKVGCAVVAKPTRARMDPPGLCACPARVGFGGGAAGADQGQVHKGGCPAREVP